VDRRRPLLASSFEQLTDERLAKVAEQHGVRIFPKPRVADALDIYGSGLNDAEYHYALIAHFDFVVGHRSTGLPFFAVEYDGPQHDTDPNAIVNDGMKNTICERLGLPLLRLTAGFLEDVNGYGILEWLIDAWFAWEAFGFSDDFVPEGVYETGTSGWTRAGTSGHGRHDLRVRFAGKT
jgi:hypothetical protein